MKQEAYLISKECLDKIIEQFAHQDLQKYRNNIIPILVLSYVLALNAFITFFITPSSKWVPIIALGIPAVLAFIGGIVLWNRRKYSDFLKLEKDTYDNLIYLDKARQEIDYLTEE